MQKIAPHLYLISPSSLPRYPYANCLLVEDERSVVIDFGAGSDAFSEIAVKDIQIGLISHFHFDHLHCNVLFPQAEFYAGKEEKDTYVKEEAYLRFHGYDIWEEVMDECQRPLYGQVVPLADNVPVQPGFRPIKLAGVFQDQQVLSCGRRTIRAVHLPGHTAGHYGFYFEPEGILFSGDIDLLASGPWYNSASGDVGDLLSSIRTIKELDPSMIIPSHRRIQTRNLHRSLNQYKKVVLDREEEIYCFLHRPRRLQDIYQLKLAFPHPANIYEEFWNRMTVRNHLKHLVKIEKVVQIAPDVYGQVV